jgi:hypothetical protein
MDDLTLYRKESLPSIFAFFTSLKCIEPPLFCVILHEMSLSSEHSHVGHLSPSLVVPVGGIWVLEVVR